MTSINNDNIKNNTDIEQSKKDDDENADEIDCFNISDEIDIVLKDSINKQQDENIFEDKEESLLNNLQVKLKS